MTKKKKKKENLKEKKHELSCDAMKFVIRFDINTSLFDRL